MVYPLPAIPRILTAIALRLRPGVGLLAGQKFLVGQFLAVRSKDRREAIRSFGATAQGSGHRCQRLLAHMMFHSFGVAGRRLLVYS